MTNDKIKFRDKESRPDAQLKQIAVDLVDGKIFSDRHIKENSIDLRMVFMPIALGAFANFEEEDFKNIGFIFEYLSEAGPRSVNGYPGFFSFQMLTRAETERMFEFYDEYKNVKENFTSNHQSQL
jgi:hypothetical protein